MIHSFRTKSTTPQQFEAFCTTIEPYLQLIFCNKDITNGHITFYDEYGEPIFTAYETEQNDHQYYSLVQPSSRADELYTILAFMIEFDMATYQPIQYTHQQGFAEQLEVLHKKYTFEHPDSQTLFLQIRLSKAEETIETLQMKQKTIEESMKQLQEAVEWLQTKYIESVD